MDNQSSNESTIRTVQNFNIPTDPILHAVQSWLYDSPNLQNSMDTFANKNAENYERDPDAELWPIKMKLLHHKYEQMIERSLGDMLHERGFTWREFSASVNKAIRNDSTSADSVLIRLVVSAMDYRTFEILLKKARDEKHHEKKLKQQDKLKQYHAKGGKVIQGRKHDIDHHL